MPVNTMDDCSEFLYDMGYTTTEFCRVLKGEFTGEKSEFICNNHEQNSWRISHKDSAMMIEIHINEKPPRLLGAMSLPVLQVIFTVCSATTLQSDLFFEKFFKYFHKGGG